MNKFLRIAISVALPLVYLLGMVRLVLAGDAFLRFEYARPDFTPDGYTPFGMYAVPEAERWQTPERLEYAVESLWWLSLSRPQAEMAAMRQHSGAPLYSAAEISHMVDVQRVTNAATLVLGVALGTVLAALGMLVARGEWRSVAGGLKGGGLVTWFAIGALAVLLVGGVNSDAWETLFVVFHQIFFPGGNWQFAYSDTLIRLFPEKLWFDFAASVLGGSLLSAALIGGAGYLWERRLGVAPAVK